MENQAITEKQPIFNLPLDGMFTFDVKQPHKLTVIFRHHSFDIDLVPGMCLVKKKLALIEEKLSLVYILTPMEEKFGHVHINVKAQDGQIYNVRMTTENLTRITQLFVEQLPPVRLNPEKPKLTLDNLGLAVKEYEQLREYYKTFKLNPELTDKKGIFKRKDTGLPRTVVYVPDGHFKGMHALLKSHGPMVIGSEVGLGAYNLVSFVLPLDIEPPLLLSQMNVFRSGKINHCNNEPNTNELLINATNIYSVGVEFIYKGSFRSREGTKYKLRKANEPKDFIPQEQDVFKIGYLLNYMEAGTYRDVLRKHPKFSYLEAIVFNLKYAQALATLHNTHKTLHRDQKSENIFLTKDWDPKLGDFGFAALAGETITPAGNPLFNAPEILKAGVNEITANPSSDVWALGLILMCSLGGINFLREWNNKFTISDDFNRNIQCMINCMETVKDLYIEKYRNLIPQALPLINIIEKCLQIDPKKRLKAIDVYNRLGVIYYDLISEQEKLAFNQQI